ncbi:Nudix family hydrolase [Chitinimonas arctica]|uniref:8-oxo-dGTP diphosphatase n=1 Tax=Chitinimonas arctica TaxID=2594795 RepID=A0A516SD73_9NEIS|nr:Nudix family hydrolase [Chitinimonas arctica]QDQ26103.1 Nudix family hydrolase [Chitinimonas arctica]
MSTIKITHVAAGILIQPDGRFLLGSRPAGKPYAGWWEFPGGKLEAGETPLQALCRELQEELGIEVRAAQPWLVQEFTYPHATVRLYFFKVTDWQGEPHPHEGQQFAWQTAGALSVEPVLPANTPILRGLQLPATLAFSNVAEMGEAAWLESLATQLREGMRWLVLREPQLDERDYAALAGKALALVRASGGNLLLHGRPELLRELEADGVHLPARELLKAEARPEGWCGASVHNAAELAQAARLGLDYAVLGSVKPSLSHPGGPVLGWAGFQALVEQGWPFPVYGVGGLTSADLDDARLAGAQGVVMLRAAWQ